MIWFILSIFIPVTENGIIELAPDGAFFIDLLSIPTLFYLSFPAMASIDNRQSPWRFRVIHFARIFFDNRYVPSLFSLFPSPLFCPFFPFLSFFLSLGTNHFSRVLFHCSFSSTPKRIRAVFLILHMHAFRADSGFPLSLFLPFLCPSPFNSLGRSSFCNEILIQYVN